MSLFKSIGMPLAVVNFTTYEKSIAEALDIIDARAILARQNKILIKPNLINKSPYPVTTPPECCEAVITYILRCADTAEIVIAEGCGDMDCETDEVFKALGYDLLAEKYSIKLIDLNTAPLRKCENKQCRYFPVFYLPEIAFTHFIISVPVLKAHSLAIFTGALKNMMGFAPPKHYSGRYGSWKKALFHGNMQQSIMDLAEYRLPDLSIMDATAGLPDFHLGGPVCDPPVGKILADFDPYEVDRKGATLLGMDWKQIGHLAKQSL
jgi:uncharacterized protein (DUF362 family)